MGVQGLWELLAPVGRRVSVDTLAGKILAIDASIWMVQFMKAMRDEKGEMMRNAHLLGFFRRICKLLFLRAKPVFVFDGATPALKRRTLASRRRHRDAAQAKIRKTAEKLLISHLKARRLEELAAELKKSSGNKKENEKGKQVESTSHAEQEKLDELLAKSLAAEEEMDVANGASSSARIEGERESEDEEDEEMILNVTDDNIDPAVLASLPPSMQLDLLVQMRERVMAENRQKYQKIKQVPEKFSELQIQSYLKTVAFRREIDQVQRIASGRDLGGVQTSKIASETNREFIFSSNFTGDKQALAMQVGSNGDNPSDKTMTNPKPSDSVVLNTANNTSKSGKEKTGKEKTGKENPTNETEKDFGPGVETYTDERGRVRVSRVRALGIRMTRDIQRNLDFMREFEQERERNPKQANVGSSSDLAGEKSIEISFLEDQNEAIDDIFLNLAADKEAVEYDESESIWEEGMVEEEKENEILKFDKMENNIIMSMEGNNILEEAIKGSLERGFEEKNEKENEIVVMENNNEGDDEIDWEDGNCEIISSKEGKGNEISKDDEMENDILMEESDTLKEGFKEKNEKENEILVRENSNDGDEVDWEDGNCEILSSKIEEKHEGALEEEDLINEVIKRSLDEDFVEKNKRENGKLKGALEEEDLINEAIKRSLDETFDEKNKRENGKLIEENEKGDDGIDWEDGNYEIISSSKIEGKSKGVLEEDDSMQEAIRKSFEDKTEGKSKGALEEDDLIQEAIRRSLKDFETQKDVTKTTENIKTTEKGNIVDSSHKFQQIAQDLISEKVNSEKQTQNISPVKDTVLTNQVYNTGNTVNTDGDASVSELTRVDVAVQDNYLSDINEADLEEEMSVLRQEQRDLGDQRKKLESHAESVSSEMFAECQELLQMFGLPYIIAPTEAEAQCAFMEMNNLVDGVVTDDSDVFLFGARSVYKNIFDDRKYVETYFMKDIESELGLNREMLIRMAMLLGSDYTEGVSGIGIVNAIEVVHAFPEEDGLKKFREWIESPDPSILGSFDKNLKKKSSKLNNDNNAESTSTENQDIKEIFMSKHRNVSKNWHIPSTFPSELVFNAYVSPQVDDSKEKFSWGKPDLSLLRKLCWDKFGWNIQKADDLLTPVLKEYNKHETQLRLEAFYTFNERFAKIRSQRIKKAIKGITGNVFPNSDESQKDKNLNKGESSHVRTKTKKKEQKSAGQKGKARKRKKAGAKRENVEPESIDCSTSAEESDKNESQNDINMAELRRSTRQRKEVKYTEEEIRADDFNNLSHFQPESNDEINQVEDQELQPESNDEINQVENQHFQPELNVEINQVENQHIQLESNDEINQVDNQDHNNNNILEGEAACSRDYIFSGGGFCTDEGNEEGNQIPDLSGGELGKLGNEMPDLGREESGKTGNEIPDLKEDVNETGSDGLSVGGKGKPVLRAMPSLRRRRGRR